MALRSRQVKRKQPAKPQAESSARIDQVVNQALDAQSKRNAGYREQSLKIHPWVCGRCGRVFTRETLSELTVHHVDHNHDNNPTDGSNWENLCVYCHDREHEKMHDHAQRSAGGSVRDDQDQLVAYQDQSGAQEASDNPFAKLKGLIDGN
ncbi:YajD family HNH nuclease [Magnetofaba australis]|uniref:Putative HNH nuclease YajD n=1 Tax=Magnetofaba australis IT-1 TaxID=1434232 RepID=A0A1Y2K668_9PROT|nr:YajD family HNH nuclease [Magnetofaba australis]OSM05119.1 putative HNH endonuclease [Magnetofaba australis IT-1]